MPKPTFRAAPVRVRVPATSANLGPGFDALGLALSLYDDIVVRAMRAAFDRLGGRPAGLELVCANRIPHGRGLGSSAAAIVGGVMAARALVAGGAERMSDEEVLALASDLEGHADNVAACLYGGLAVAWTDGDGGHAVRLPVSEKLTPVAFVPGTSSSTRAARRMLPDTVPHDDAARNAGRAALLVAALANRLDLLLVATEDLLHQPYRAPAMPRSAALVEELRADGIPAVVSGAGPTVLALTTAATRDAALAVTRRGWSTLALDVDTTGAALLPLELSTPDQELPVELS